MKLTDEQTAVMDALDGGASCVKVEAGAGTGKTSTIVAAARHRPRARGILAVLNRLMAEETKSRLAGTSCEATMLHSLAYRSGVAEPFKERLKMRLHARTAAQAADVSGPVVVSGVGLSHAAVGYLLIDWVSRYCRSADATLDGRHFPSRSLKVHIGAELAKQAEKDRTWFATLCQAFASQLLPGANMLWKKLRDPAEKAFPSTHDVYLKLYVMGEPKIEADYVMLDEAQDANPIMQAFKQLAARQGAQTVYVGDSHQQLYAWRGAVDAMHAVPSDTTLRLTNSFRFRTPVADVANAILGGMMGSDFRIVGAGGPSRIVGNMSRPTAVICRSNAESIEMALELQREGVRCGLCMEPKGLEREIATLERFQARGRSDDRRYCHFGSYGELEEAVMAGTLPNLKVIMTVIDEHGFAGAKRILSNLAVGKSAEAIARARVETVLLTGHAAKGLQFRHVLLGSDFRSVLGKEPRQEKMNLLYVAVARAQSTLCLGASDAAGEIQAVMCRAGAGLGTQSRGGAA